MVLRRRMVVVPVLLLAWLAAEGGCARKPADPVAALLGDLESAAEARDAARFAEKLSPAFRTTSGASKEEALADLRRYFGAYESVALDVYGVEGERQGAKARVRCVVEFSGRARPLGGLAGFLPPSAVYRFDLDVADEDGTWRVRGASWEAVEPAASPGASPR